MQALREALKSRLSAADRARVRAAIDTLKWPVTKLRGLWAVKGYEASLPFTAGRRWRSAIPFDLHHTFQRGTINYTYRDVPCLKHPVEMALYSLLIWEAKPRTIFEIGSKAGGSALWLADLMRTYGLDGRIISVDINPPSPPYKRDEITFLRGDARQLADCLGPEQLSLPHPWLIIEDSSHHYDATLGVLKFFDPLMRSGEYVVVEDGNVSDMGDDAHRGGGPCRAISQFLMETDGRYEIDPEYCDRYGHNVTGNPNGYIRKR